MNDLNGDICAIWAALDSRAPAVRTTTGKLQ